MKIVVVFLIVGGIIADLLFCQGEHLAAVGHWVGGLLNGIRTGGNIWGA